MEGWETERLGNACELITRGVAPKYLAGGGLCVLNQRCVRDHSIDYSFARRHDHTTKPVKTDRIIKAGDVLVNSTGTGTLGRVAQVRQEPPEPTTVDTHVTIVRPKPGRFYPDFFGYIAISIEDQLAASGEGASGQTELSRTAIADKFQISYPRSLPEQQRIVAILDEAFEGIDKAIANTKQNLANARELLTNARESILSPNDPEWISTTFSQVCDIKHGFAFEGRYFTSSGEFVLLTPGNFFEAGGYRDRGEKQKFYGGSVPDEFVLDAGDLLVAMTEQAAGLLGSPILVPETRRFLHNQRLGLVQVKAGVHCSNEFLFHVFNTRRVRAAIHDSASGVKVRHTSPKKIGDVAFSLPTSLDEQRAIVARLDALYCEIQELKQTYLRKLAALNELKTATLAHAFAGRLGDGLAVIQEAAE